MSATFWIGFGAGAGTALLAVAGVIGWKLYEVLYR